MPPLISVVMPVWNAERFLADAIGSIRAQTHPDWELIVVDDGSTDRSLAIARAMATADPRIRAVRVEHGGHVRAFGRGIALARGKLIARMDADDIAAPERLAVQLAWMASTGVELCGSWAKRFGDSEALMWFPDSHDAIHRELVFRSSMLAPTMLARVEAFAPYHGRVPFGLEEVDLLVRLAGRHRLGNVPAALLRYRSHSHQRHVRYREHNLASLRELRPAAIRLALPEASSADIEAIEQVAASEPFPSVAALEHAGRLLGALADSPDSLLRQRMRERWRRACRGSTHLGPRVYRTYRQLLPVFDETRAEHDCALYAAAALRVRRGSRLEHAIRPAHRLLSVWP